MYRSFNIARIFTLVTLGSLIANLILPSTHVSGAGRRELRVAERPIATQGSPVLEERMGRFCLFDRHGRQRRLLLRDCRTLWSNDSGLEVEREFDRNFGANGDRPVPSPYVR